MDYGYRSGLELKMLDLGLGVRFMGVRVSDCG